MAQFNFTGSEIVNLLRKNRELPPRIKNLRGEGNAIIVTVDPPIPMLPAFDVSLEFDHFQNETAYLNMRGLGPVNKLLGYLGLEMAEAVRISKSGQLEIDVNTLLADKMDGVRVDNVSYDEDMYKVTLNMA